MPWAAPIGSGQGINDPRSLKILRSRLPEITLIIDAGIGKPSHATQVMEMGYDGVLLNSAIALANQPVEMARAFALAIEAGKLGHESGFMEERVMASPSTPTIGTPFVVVQTGKNSLDNEANPPSQLKIEKYFDANSNDIPISPKPHTLLRPLNSQSKHKPIAWTIGGSDSGGGAGIQADIKTFNALGVHGCSVITALTAQNTLQVLDIESVSPAMIEAQMKILLEDLPPLAVKTGMFYSSEIIKLIARFFAKTKAFKICDPVLVSSTGNSLISQEEAMRTLIDDLLPTVDLLTPNLPEAEALLAVKNTGGWQNQSYIKELAAGLRALGAKAVLIKGGHARGDNCLDYFEEEGYSTWLTSKRIDTKSTHGTGCTLSAAITACLALGYPLPDAVVIAKAYVNQGLRTAQIVGQGVGPMTHGGWPESFTDLPTVSTSNLLFTENLKAFPDCGNIPLGVYPIVDSDIWLEKLLPLGFTTVQLRIKTGATKEIEQQIVKSVEISRRFNCRLFINDHWQLAIDHGAYGVHLGQEDLDKLTGADVARLCQSGIRLGLSAHSYAEMARAIALKPSYIAFGPIYQTNTKNVPFAPQGIQSLRRWRHMLPFPMVAIGGITLQILPEVLGTGVDGAAVISDILQAKEPLVRAKTWLETYTKFQESNYKINKLGTELLIASS